MGAESGATQDTLQTITATGVYSGAMLVLKQRNATEEINVIHATSTAATATDPNIYLGGQADTLLDSREKSITLFYDDQVATATGWYETTSRPSTEGVAKAWVMFNHTGTAAIRSSFNITSITDDGVGLATITIETDFSGADVYTAAGIAEEVSGSGCFVSIEDGTAPTAGALAVAVYRDTGALTDSARVGVVMFGDQ